MTKTTFEEGLGFDGSSIRGWKAINESDMLVKPVPETAFIDPFCRETTLTLICNIHDPLTHEDYTRDPRNVARKAVNYMKSTGIAEKAFFGPEVQFFVFDDVRYDQTPHSAYYHVDSAEGAWNSGREEKPNLGHKLRYAEGYFPCPPSDAMHDLRSEIMRALIECGLRVEAHRHEAATGGQGVVDIRYDDLIRTADNVLKYKYVVKNVARRHGKTATFMPKPLFNDHGSAMNVHVSLWKNGDNVFAGSRSAGGFAMRACRTRPSTRSAACSSTPRPCARFRTRRPIATSVWCRDSTRRSILPTVSAIARRRFASRSRGRTRRPSASSIVCRTRPAIRT